MAAREQRSSPGTTTQYFALSFATRKVTSNTSPKEADGEMGLLHFAAALWFVTFSQRLVSLVRQWELAKHLCKTLSLETTFFLKAEVSFYCLWEGEDKSYLDKVVHFMKLY